MELTENLLSELQRRLKIGNRRGVHLNAIPTNSRYKFDLNRLSLQLARAENSKTTSAMLPARANKQGQIKTGFISHRNALIP